MVTRFPSISVRFAAVAVACLAFASAVGCNRDPNVRKQKYLDSGNRFLKQEKYREAVIQYSNAIKVDPNYEEAHYALAKTYIAMGAMMPAYSELVRAVDAKPSDQKARLDLGNVELGGGLADKAEEQARAVLAMNPTNPDALALLANVEFKTGKRDQALSDIRHALQIDPNSAKLHTTLGLIEAADKQTVAASEQELLKALSLDPKAPGARLALAGLLDAKGDFAGSLQQATAAVQSDPKDLQARSILAALYIRGGDKAKAEQTLRQTADDFSDNKEAIDLLGRYYAQSRQMDAASAAYADLVSRHPNSVPMKVAYAQILVTKGDVDKARPVIKELDKKNSATVDVRGLDASLLVKDGKISEAFDLLQKTAKENPDSADAQDSFGKLAEIKGDAAVAQTAYQRAAQLSPGDLDVKRGLARTALRRSDMSLLSQVANDTIAHTPGFAEAYLWRGIAEANQNEEGKAEADFQAVLKNDPNNTPGLLSLAQLRLKQHRGADAVPLLQKALEIDPNSFDALSRLVSYNLEQKQPARAMLLVQQQIAKAPQNAGFYGLLSSLQFLAKDFSGARDSAQKAMQLNPNERQFVHEYAQAVGGLGDRNSTLVAWQHWIASHPSDSDAIMLLGSAQEDAGDKMGAIESYKKALQIDPHQIAASNNLAYLMVETGQNTDVALSLAQTARQALPNSPDTADTLAWVYYHKGTYASARDLLEDALKQAPNNVSINYHLGMVYSQLGDKSNAILYLKKAATLGADTQTAKDAQAALRQFGG